MNLKDVHEIKVYRTQRRRVGRGWGSGMGKTSTRGEKGQGRRGGTRFRLRFEGGQMPLYRRLPKKGFSNHAFRIRFEAVNVGDLEKVFDAGATIDLEALRGALLVPKNADRWKLLGDGSLSKKLAIKVHAASKGAKAKIEAAGGTVEILEGPAKERAAARVIHQENLAKKSAIAFETDRAEAKKVGKPKKESKGPKAKVAKPKAEGGGAPKVEGGGKPKAEGGGKGKASQKDPG
jgi:large subunit ribosomal protein L15